MYDMPSQISLDFCNGLSCFENAGGEPILTPPPPTAGRGLSLCVFHLLQRALQWEYIWAISITTIILFRRIRGLSIACYCHGACSVLACTAYGVLMYFQPVLSWPFWTEGQEAWLAWCEPSRIRGEIYIMGARHNCSSPTGLALGFLLHSIKPGIKAAGTCVSESIRVFSPRYASHLQPELEAHYTTLQKHYIPPAERQGH